MSRLYEYLRAIRRHLLGFALRIYLYSTGCKVGKDLRCLGFPVFRDIPHGNIQLGDRVVIGKGVVFEINRNGSLHLGDEVVIGDGVRLSSAGRIQIGDWSGVAEHSSLRGSFHKLERNRPYMQQGDTVADIIIGKDALIGAHCVVLQGSEIPDGAVIGALSLVSKSDKLHAYGIFAGSPIKHIRDRT